MNFQNYLLRKRSKFLSGFRKWPKGLDETVEERIGLSGQFDCSYFNYWIPTTSLRRDKEGSRAAEPGSPRIIDHA